MAKKVPSKGQHSESCRACIHSKSVKERGRLLELLESAIDKMQKALKEEGFKPSIGDYVKLVQMEKDIGEADGQVKEIIVTWVDATDSDSEE